jgi:hypothetical protein
MHYRNINRRNYVLNRARYGAISKAWAARNPERVRTAQKRWRIRNPGIARARASEARASRIMRRVAWANAAAIASFYREAERLTKALGGSTLSTTSSAQGPHGVRPSCRVTCASLRHQETQDQQVGGWERLSGNAPLGSGDAPPSS